MSEIIIEKGIPIPHRLRKNGSLKDILSKLEVGDSFLWPLNRRASILPSAQKLNISITTQKLEDKVRVWRITKPEDAVNGH